ITWGPDCFYRNLAEEKLRQAKIPFAVILECPSVAGMLAAITTGLGVGILNQYSVEKAICNVSELEKLMPLPSVDCLLRLNKHRLNPASEAFCEMLIKLMQK
ncbi:LysR substrate-binding domain-containing protein, partial [Pantoea sp. DY-5]